jgi:hypothetical protein
MKKLISQPHMILSVENSLYPDKVKLNISHEDAIKELSLGQNNVHSVAGHYGSPRRGEPIPGRL